MSKPAQEELDATANEAKQLVDDLGLLYLNYFKRLTNQNVDIVGQFAGLFYAIEKTNKDLLAVVPEPFKQKLKDSLIRAIYEGGKDGTTK